MKIPPDTVLYTDLGSGIDMIAAWQKAAEQASVEFGILVELKIIPRLPQEDVIDRLVFTVLNGELEFESLNDVKRALTNKAFL